MYGGSLHAVAHYTRWFFSLYSRDLVLAQVEMRSTAEGGLSIRHRNIICCHFDTLRVRVFRLWNMEAILNELGVGILKETFEAERVKPKVVACLSDGNLAFLRRSHTAPRTLHKILGKKTKMRAMMREKNYEELVLEERNHLFQPNRSSSSGRGRKRRSACPQSQKQWSF